MRSRFIALLLGSLFVMAGCPSTNQVCDPGETQSCTCAGGLNGGQACGDDGLGWDDCDCGSGDDDTGDDDTGDDDTGDDDTGDDDTGDDDTGDDDTGDIDNDGDGYTPEEGDCDDSNAAINPAATDMVGDDNDQNCDGVDGTDADGDGIAADWSGGEDCDDNDSDIGGCGEFLLDADGDGYGVTGDEACLCTAAAQDPDPREQRHHR